MNDYIVTIDQEKYSINTTIVSKIKIGESRKNTEIIKLSNHTYKVFIDGKVYHVTTNKLTSNKYSILVDGHYFEPVVRTKLEEEALLLLGNSQNNGAFKKINSPMPGLILRIEKNIGDKVEEGEPLILLEAMKMENEIRASTSGVISEIFVDAGESVEKGQLLINIK